MSILQQFRSRHRQGVIAAATAATLVLAACGGSSGGTTSNGPGGTKKAKVAIATRDFSNPYWAALRNGAVYEGKELQVPVDVQAGQNETDSAGENAAISTLVSQDFTCFGAVPVDATNIITPLLPAESAHKPIINIDTAIDPGAAKSAGLKVTSFIGSDNSMAGQVAAQEMLKLLNNHGQVAILEGIPGEKNGIARETAFRAATSGKLQVVQATTADYETAKALTVTQDILRVHPGITGIFAADDEMGIGAAQAVANAGLTKQVKVVSIDGIQEALHDVQSGTLAATVSQYPYVEGIMTVQACQALAEGKTIPARVVSPIELITPANAATALARFPEPFFAYDNPIASLIAK